MQTNELLARVPRDTRTRWEPFLAPVTLAAGAVLHDVDSPVSYVYFPVTTVVAHILTDPLGNSLSLAFKGSADLVGAATVLGRVPPPHRSEVLFAGQALRLEAGHLRAEFLASALTRQLLLAYTQGVATETAQTALCAHFHTPEQQLGRLLLRLTAVSRRDELSVTQTTLALLLGSRRERVNEITGRWARDGIIDLGRGRLAVQDWAALRARTCTCHEVIDESYNQVRRQYGEA